MAKKAKGWIYYGRPQFPGLAAAIASIELEAFSKWIPDIVNHDESIYYLFRNWGKPLRIYRKWGIPNG